MTITCYKDVLLDTVKSKTVIGTDANGKIIDGTAGAEGLFLKLDQTTPQSVTGGIPSFVGGLRVGTAVATYGGLVYTDGSAPEASQVLTDAEARVMRVYGNGASYFMGRDVTNNIEFIMGTSSTGLVFLGAMTNHQLQLRTNNSSKWTIQAAGHLVSGTDGTVAYNITTAGTFTGVSVVETTPTLLKLNQGTSQTISGSPIFNWGTATHIPYYAADKKLTNSANFTYASGSLNVSNTSSGIPVKLTSSGDGGVGTYGSLAWYTTTGEMVGLLSSAEAYAAKFGMFNLYGNSTQSIYLGEFDVFDRSLSGDKRVTGMQITSEAINGNTCYNYNFFSRNNAGGYSTLTYILQLQATGNVYVPYKLGVATNNPQAQVDVYGGSGSATDYVYSNNFTTVYGNIIPSSISGYTDFGWLYDDGVGNIYGAYGVVATVDYITGVVTDYAGTAYETINYISYSYSANAGRFVGNVLIDPTYAETFRTGTSLVLCNSNAGDIINESGANCHLLMTNPTETGQIVWQGEIGGVTQFKLRVDYVGDLSWVSYATASGRGHYFYVGGDYDGSSPRCRILVQPGGTHIGKSVAGGTASAYLHLQAGTTASGTAPLKFTAGSLMTGAESGTFEYFSGNFYIRNDGFVIMSDTKKFVTGGGSDFSFHYDGTQGIIDSSLVAASDILVKCGTDKTIVLNETVWDDLRVTPSGFDRAGIADPALVSYTPTGSSLATYLYEFQLNDIGYFTVQLPHGYKQGTDISVHIHWTPGLRGNEESGKKVGWKVDYAWANIDGTFGAMGTADLSDACDGTDDKHQMTPAVTITGTGKNISSMLICNVKRTDTGADDDWAGTASGQLPMLLEIDFHYEIDTIGSRQIGTK